VAEKNPRINDYIKASHVRVIDPDGNQLGIVALEDALETADEYELDLVEVAPHADPPVCRIMDFGKFKYQQKKRQAEAKKNSSRVELKEVKFRPKTDTHDRDTKLRHARKFLEGRNRVKLSVMFRGREMAHPELGERLLLDCAELLADVADVEQRPRMEGRNMTMFLVPGGTTQNGN
jgi:translation initiation factor IF-3